MNSAARVAVVIGVGITLLPSVAFPQARAYDAAIGRAAKTHDLPEVLIKAIIATESSFRPTAQNPNSSARGLMQITKAAARDVGFNHANLDDPDANIAAGSAYLARMVRRFGFLEGIMAYNIGPGNMERGKHLLAGTVYASKVIAYILAFGSNELVA